MAEDEGGPRVCGVAWVGGYCEFFLSSQLHLMSSHAQFTMCVFLMSQTIRVRGTLCNLLQPRERVIMLASKSLSGDTIRFRIGDHVGPESSSPHSSLVL